MVTENRQDPLDLPPRIPTVTVEMVHRGALTLWRAGTDVDYARCMSISRMVLEAALGASR
jgi:hypothetical protein